MVQEKLFRFYVRRDRKPFFKSRLPRVSLGMNVENQGGRKLDRVLQMRRKMKLQGINMPTAFIERKDCGISYKPGKVGAVFGDFDNSGSMSLFVPQLDGRCKLFKNDAQGRFADVTAMSGDLAKPLGMATCAAWGDVDGDGHLDLIVGCLRGPNRFLRNRGDGTFEDATEAVGLNRRTGVLILNSIKCDDPHVQMDSDLVQTQIELRPSESYRCTIPVRVPHPRQVNLSSFRFAFANQLPDGNAGPVLQFQAAARLMTVKPAIGKEIETIVKPICRYDEGVKVSVTFVHQGTSEFKDWSLSIGPASEIKAGKPTVQKPVFKPGERETLELVVLTDNLDVVHSATIDGTRGEFRQKFSVTPPPPADSKRFRFLEPTRLAQDSVRVFRLTGDDRMYAEKRQEAFVLRGGERYLVEIEPRNPRIQDLKLNGLGHQVQVLKSERKSNVWTFTIDVVTLGLFRISERLFYEVAEQNGKLSGEIPICLVPHWTRHISFATTLCAFLSVQGLVGLKKWVSTSDHSAIQTLAEFSTREHLPLVAMTVSTPFLWIGMKICDWTQYRMLR